MDLAKMAPASNDPDTQELSDIVIIGYSNVGSLSGVSQAIVQVEAREIIIPDRGSASYYVRVELSSGGDYPRDAFASVNFKDVERLISMVRRLENTLISTDRFSLSEVQYEIDNLKLIVFNTGGGSTMAAIQTGGVSVHLNSPAKLAIFADLLEKARDHIDAKRLR